MLHQNPNAYSNPVFPGFTGASTSGTPSVAGAFASRLPGTSQDASGLDPSGWCNLFSLCLFISNLRVSRVHCSGNLNWSCQEKAVQKESVTYIFDPYMSILIHMDNIIDN